MRYLITSRKFDPFFTEWFDAENNFESLIGMVVYDLTKGVYTFDGVTWHEITRDHL